jgi:alpha-glucosidase (family GH31 glycosyl hydrolase)
MNEAEARPIVDTIRTKNIPCDALVLDLQWFRNMGDLSWDRALWPNPEAMMSDFRLRGIKTILITEPYIDEPSGNFDEAAKLGYLAKDSTGKPYLLDRWWSCGGCNASLLDLTMPAAAAWWWKKHPAFLGSQVAGIWTDLGEPERHPRDMLHFLGSAGKIHNIYNLIWAKIIYEGLARYRPGERIFNLTRSGFAGIQRYGVIPWSGDVARDFGGLAVQLPMLLNMGMSGIAYHNSDIGGYARNPTTPELYIRWMQYGTFCPITRAHGAGEVVKGYPTEPWRFGPEAEKICKSFIELRYRLIPYIYTLAHENYATGIPLARPLFWEDPGNRDLFNESSAYFWGDAFVVSPVVKAGETSKEVYLPEGRWFDFWTDKVFAGGKRYIVAAPIDIMPLFVRGGSIIPMAPTMEYTDERPLDTLTLLMYPPTDGESAYTLYEDDGKTNAYESGSYGLTTFTLSRTNTETGSTLNFTIGSTRGSFNGKIRRRVYIAEIHSVSSLPSAVIVNGTPYTVARNASELSRRNTGFYYDTAKSIIIVPVACNTESVYQISLRGFR